MDANVVRCELNALLAEAGLEPLDEQTASQFGAYVSLFLRWNARLNLSAIRDEKGVISRHFIESIAFARALPKGISTCWISVPARAYRESLSRFVVRRSP